ncbi:putative E3 ubiquitin-protein ligase XBAT31 isoform X2 [Apium graveolens]|uniref:putative E3 ubiquitin-protein ligase XBAT31 isoform X2 n=1 Tax=Apium graveolens TaxID=4045 RepID=UPI003D7C01A5
MGQGISCVRDGAREHALFRSVQNGELEIVKAMVDYDPSVLRKTTVHGKLFALHVAAVHDQILVLSMLLDRSVNPDILNRHRQTPLMLAAMSGNISCIERLIEAGANVLMFDSLHVRTCLHYAAYHGHLDCLQAIISAAHSSQIAYSWGFLRFVNIRDGSGATPLHLAARQGSADCVHILLASGALVSASTCGYGCSYPGSTPLHLAARGGSLDCVRELLAWGGDRLQTDSSGKIPYTVALKHKHAACAALFNPSSPEPLLWPARLNFISDLNLEARTLLEKALITANKEREKEILKDTMNSFPSSPVHSDSGAANDFSEESDIDLCSICFEKICTIVVKDCGHQMCAQCMLILCCHNKPNAASNCSKSPLCPFCRSNISQLVVANVITNDGVDEEQELSPSKPRRSSRRSFNSEGGSSSFKSLSALSSFGRAVGRSSGRVAADCIEDLDKF